MKIDNKTHDYFEIPILSGIYSDLSILDFSFLNIKLIEVKSQTFEDYLKEIEPKLSPINTGFLDAILEDDYNDNPDRKYAIVEDNPKNGIDLNNIYNVYQLLLIIFPSDLQIEFIIEFHCDDGIWQSPSMSSFYKRLSNYEREDLFLLMASDDELQELNRFSKKYFSKLKMEGYLGIAIENYISSFSASRDEYKYLNLCMGLESIIPGSHELTYRLRRNVAILCGKNAWHCKHIYNNINKFYALRSKIIHGEKYSEDQLEKYLPKIRALVSRLIIELMIHDIDTNVALNERITELGYGDRSRISKNWEHFDLNISTWVVANIRSLDQ